MRTDSTGIWAYTIQRFPGIAGGRHYALAPGEARVIAVDAIDHRSLALGLQDLSAAHFESIGTDVDPNNPFADDMVRLTRLSSFEAHGPRLVGFLTIGVALAVATDTTQLQRARLEGAQGDPASVFKIPRDAILDVVSFDETPESFAQFQAVVAGHQRCEPFISATFDREAAHVSARFSVQDAFSGKSLGRTAAGAEILQRTRNTARDIELAYPLRRSLLRPR